jgi:hypothetical protein
MQVIGPISSTKLWIWIDMFGTYWKVLLKSWLMKDSMPTSNSMVQLHILQTTPWEHYEKRWMIESSIQDCDVYDNFILVFEIFICRAMLEGKCIGKLSYCWSPPEWDKKCHCFKYGRQTSVYFAWVPSTMWGVSKGRRWSLWTLCVTSW